ncbi:MAG: RNase adapter RapZ [Myxococcota bacterium]|nr:RNase adapter RapZ [Myxococcota bacterium]
MELVVLSGLSGSGKTSALRALEDAGYLCVDNLPTALLETFIRLAEENASVEKIAVVMDIREMAFGDDVARHIDQIRASGQDLRLVYFDANDDRLITRFKETRRQHPLITVGEAATVAEAISLERTWLQPIRVRASTVIDSSELTVHDLKRRTRAMFVEAEDRRLTIHLLSFGFRHGLPPEADFVFDVRFVPNPYFVETLRDGTGLDPEVSAYVLKQPSANMILGHIAEMATDVLPLAQEEGKYGMTIAVGCTGGHHRSVAIVQALAAQLATRGLQALVTHRDVEK